MAKAGARAKGAKTEERQVVGRRLWVVGLSWEPVTPRYGQEAVKFKEQSRLAVFWASDFEGAAPFSPSRTLVSRALFSAQAGLKSVSALDPALGGEGEARWVMQRVVAKGDQEPTEAMWEAALEALCKACGASARAGLPLGMWGAFEDARSSLRWFGGDKKALEQTLGASRAALEASVLSASASAPEVAAEPKSRACRV